MSNFAKPLHTFTEKELQESTNNWDPRYGALALYELQRRLQEKNTKQIGSLTKEIGKLKNVVELGAETAARASRNSNRLAKTAVWIAGLSMLSQLLFSIHQDMRCGIQSGGTGDPLSHYSDCYRTFDLGVFGKQTFKVKDFEAPSGI